MTLDTQIKTICKISQGSSCCKYIVCGPDGFQCMKINLNTKRMIDDNWKTTPHVSQGDNCEGVDLQKL